MKAYLIVRRVYNLLENDYWIKFHKGGQPIRKLADKNNVLYLLGRKITTQGIRDNIWELFTFLRQIKIDVANNSFFKMPSDQKLFALDFLDYIYLKNPDIPYTFFPEVDRKLIEQFLEVYIYSCFCDTVPVELLGRGNLGEFRNYNKIKSGLKVSKKWYEFQGFKSYTLPDMGSFYKNYGFGYIKKTANKIAFDLGAYCGETSFLMNKMLGLERIYAFEPDLKNFKILKQNLELNDIKNVIPINSAAGITNGRSHILLAETGSKLISNKTNVVTKTNVVRLDSFVKDNGITNVDLVKMDIEGAEFDALKGAVKTLKKYKPNLIIAIYHKGQHLFEIPGWLKKNIPEYNLRFVAFSGASPVIERVIIASTQKI